ncbi:MAG: RNA polymerase sigma factor [Pirellulaceae bacterium]
MNQQLDGIYREVYPKAFATLVRVIGDFDIAEDALAEAFKIAAEQWPAAGGPDNPLAWIVSTARNKAVDVMRRNARFAELSANLLERSKQISAANDVLNQQEIRDDQLRLIFTCCHPAIDPSVQVPLTLREVCGLTTEEIANAFLVSSKAMAQRLVRGKAKIRDAMIPFRIPDTSEISDRLDSVLSVIYLVFTEGYSPTQGQALTRNDLSSEAIRLGQLLVDLLPEPEAIGLLALMLLTESRRTARVDEAGEIVLLENQNRVKWDQAMIGNGLRLVERGLRSGRVGPYLLQAAIAAVHAEAKAAADTDWRQIVARLYSVLLRINPTPVVALNRAVAVSIVDGPARGVQLIDEILSQGELSDYHLLHAARGELLKRSGQFQEAKLAFQRALDLATVEPERRFLMRQIESVSNQ